MQGEENQTNIRTEAIAGATTFLTMVYIVFVNPAILSTEGTGIKFSGALTATVLVCFSMTLMMGLYAKLPFAVAPGMGLNAFFTFSIVLGQKVAWQTALGIVFWGGVLFLIVSITPIRVTIAKAIPKNIRIAAAAGIGIFLTFIGLKNAGFIVSDPNNFVRFGDLNYVSLLTLSGILLTIFLLKKRVRLRFSPGYFSQLSWLGFLVG
jgi:AGZA family xanthine/uracil permease-like MFS transporter